MANAETSEKLRVARPTVALAGRDDVSLTQGLTRLQVNETTAGLFCCEAAFGNWGSVGGEVDYLYFDRGRLDFGKPIQIKIGSEVIFDGFVSGLEGCFPEGAGPEIVVLAEDRLQNLRMTRRTRAFEQITDADVFQRIARDHGLTSTVDVVGPMHKVLAQVNQSDLAFIRERARAIDSEVWVHDNSLHVQARGRRAR